MKKIPVGISGRHIHLSREKLDVLFGIGYELNLDWSLVQLGQFAAKEKVDVLSPTGKILNNVRIVGPIRSLTQVEIARSDELRCGFGAPIRLSGDISGSGTCKLIGPRGEVELREGVIIPVRHIHFSEEDAKYFGVKNMEVVSIKIDGIKSGTLDNVVCRVSNNFKLECNLDSDEGSVFVLKNGDTVELIK